MSKPIEKPPIWLHPNKQWAKKIKGKIRYFGVDFDKALAKYLDEKDHLMAGRQRIHKPDAATLVELANLYAAWCRRRIAAGDFAQRSYDEAADTIRRLIAMRGEDDQPAEWSPADYSEVRDELFKPVVRTVPARGGIKGPSVDRRAPSTVDGDIRRLRAFLRWCADTELMPPPRFGKSFNQSSVKQQRVAKALAGKRDLSREAVVGILGECSPYLKPLVMLGINAGLGASDLGSMQLDDYDGSQWLDYARRKTGIERRVWLWPETREAIDAYLEIRNKPFGKGNENILFATKMRQPWMRGTHDATGKAFQRAREAANLSRGSFYDLRRTFQTIGEETLDFPAVSHVMGHAAATADMAAKYRQRITDDRIKAVCEHVRTWLYGSSESQQ